MAPPTPEPKPQQPRQARSRLGGYLLALMVLLATLHAFVNAFPAWPSGVVAWMAAAMLLGRVSLVQRLLCGILILIGIAGIVFALQRSEDVALADVLTRNQSLLTMLAAVSFLRLVAIADESRDKKLPSGHSAFYRTLLGVGVFGAVINLSAPLLIADRIQGAARLDQFASRCITRIFSGCSGWSPFFGGMAVVITYVPSASLSVLMLAGLPFAIIGGLWTWAAARMFDDEKVKAFTGYPMDIRNLWIPFALAVCVTLFYFLFNLPILICIALGAMVVTVSVLVLRRGLRSSTSTIQQHIENGLSAMGSELVLFLAAGVLAVGLSASIDTDGAIISGSFSALTAVAVLAGMVIAACIGIHPIILISMLASILADTRPDPNLLAFTFLLGWSMGTSCSPLSGTHLIFQARYGIPSLHAAIGNWPFVAVMFVVASGLLMCFERLLL